MRFAILAVVLSCVLAYAVSPSSPTLPAPKLEREAPYRFPTADFVGVNSCATAGCHGGGEPGQVGSEHSTWAHRDPHFNASRVLHNSVSTRISAGLKRPMPAHQDALCLRCHGIEATAQLSPEPVPKRSAVSTTLANDGVSCEACHGPAQLYETVHYQASWKTLTDREKAERYGLYPTKDLAFRVSNCTACHVGNETQEVNHDLIAAGHPRLRFEYGSFHHRPKVYQRHWTERDPSNDFEARSWLTGRIETAKAGLRLLAARSERPTTWPELTEFRCESCHQDLGTKPTGKGLLAWSRWNIAGLEQLPETRDIVTSLRDIERLTDRPSELHSLAHSAHEKFAALGVVPVGDARRRLADVLQADPGNDWDVYAQKYLAGLAIGDHLGRQGTFPEREKMREELMRVGRGLRFPKGYDTPKGFEPAGLQGPFAELNRLFRPGTP